MLRIQELFCPKPWTAFQATMIQYLGFEYTQLYYDCVGFRALEKPIHIEYSQPY